MPGRTVKHQGIQWVSPGEEENPVEKVEDEEEDREECQEEHKVGIQWVSPGEEDNPVEKVEDEEEDREECQEEQWNIKVYSEYHLVRKRIQ